MTPQLHLASAETLQYRADEALYNGEYDLARSYSLGAIAHALIATAAESGVPHTGTAAGSGSGG